MAAKLRCGDAVVVLVGTDKGKRGKITRVLSRDKVLVKGVRFVTKHRKSVSRTRKSGRIVRTEAPIHVSNVAIVNRRTGKADRVGFRANGRTKKRIFKSDKQTIDCK